MKKAERIIVGITGASGMLYASRLLEVLSSVDIVTDVIISENARGILQHELGDGFRSDIPDDFDAAALLPSGNFTFHDPGALHSPISSGSVISNGMIIVPCSMTTLGKIASGIGDNLITRAASVTLKEKRKLVIVPRETPLNAIHLENMLRLDRAGAVIMPACPGFYQKPESVTDLIDSIIGRILDHLGISHTLDVRWDAG